MSTGIFYFRNQYLMEQWTSDMLGLIDGSWPMREHLFIGYIIIYSNSANP